MSRTERECHETRLRFPDAEAGELTPPREKAFRDHVAGCSSCHAEWSGFLQAVSEAEAALRAPSDDPPPPEGAPADYWSSFLPRLRQRLGSAEAGAGSRRPAWAVPAAAALVLGFCLGSLVTITVPRPGSSDASPPQAVETTRAAAAEEAAYEDDLNEEILLPLASETPWEDTLYETLLQELDDEERILLQEDLLDELS